MSGASVIQPWHAEAEAMWKKGVSATRIAASAGVTKNVIIGLSVRRGWQRDPGCELSQHQLAAVAKRWPERSTLFTRLDAVHARFDKLMEELKHGPPLYQPIKPDRLR